MSMDVVGKYCYYLHMPLEDRPVPVIVDVALLGRTKIIKLHSALYLKVSTSYQESQTETVTESD